MPLSPEEISALLNKEKTKATGAGAAVKNPTMQIGPLRWADESKPCSSRGCGSPCLCRVRGIPYCTTHALQMLNQFCLEHEGIDYSACSCKSGVHSKYNLHTNDCALYTTERILAPDAPVNLDILL